MNNTHVPQTRVLFFRESHMFQQYIRHKYVFYYVHVVPLAARYNIFCSRYFFFTIPVQRQSAQVERAQGGDTRIIIN